MSDAQLSIVMPAYEEAENLRWILPRLHKALQVLTVPYEILVVDTSTPHDDTANICVGAGVRYIPRRGGDKYGHAVRTGIQEAYGQYIIFMDADGSHSPDFIQKLWAQHQQVDCIIASRYVAGGGTENVFVLILMSLAVNVVFRIVLGLKCADVSNSFRLYRADQLKALTLECDHFDIVEEILVKLSYSVVNFSIKEIPFTFQKRQAGKTKRQLVAFAIGYLNTLARLHRMKRRAQSAKKAV